MRLFNALPLHGIFRGASERALARSYPQLSAGTRASWRWLRARIAFPPGLQQRSLTGDRGQTADKVAKEQRRALLAAAEEALEQMDLEAFAATPRSQASTTGSSCGMQPRDGQTGAVDRTAPEKHRRVSSGDGWRGGEFGDSGRSEVGKDAGWGDGLSHIDGQTNQPTMVDVQDKKITSRTAVATSSVRVPAAVMQGLAQDAASEIQSKKGPVFATAIIAGTMAAKNTHSLIPFCHPLMLESCKFKIRMAPPDEIRIECSVQVSGKTGVEMEALTGASVAALTIYDMLKAVSHDMVIGDTMLVRKTGGKSTYVAPNQLNQVAGQDPVS